MAIQCIYSVLMKYFPNLMSHFVQLLLLSKKKRNSCCISLCTLDSSRQHKQENSSQEKEIQNHRNKTSLFRYETWNYLHSDDTSERHPATKFCHCTHPRTDQNSQEKGLVSPSLRSMPPRNQKQCSRVLSRTALAEMTLGLEGLPASSGYLLPTER